MEVVKLNIGGYKYLTKRSTLLDGVKENFFSDLLSQDNPIKDEDGCFFIDRNGKYFEPILDYLRTGQWKCPKKLDEEVALQEAKYFQVIPDGRKFVSDSDLNDIIHKTTLREDEKILQEKKELVDRVMQILADIFVKEAEKRNPNIISPIFFDSRKDVEDKFVEKQLSINGVKISAFTNLEEMKEQTMKMLEVDNWFEPQKELPLDVADAMCRHLRSKFYLSTQVIEKSIFFEWCPGTAKNAIVSTTDTRFKGTGPFYHTQLCRGIQFVWKGNDTDAADK